MSSTSLALEPVAVAVILAMALATYATKAGGLWLVGRLEVGERTETALELLPGVIVVSILAGELLEAGPAEWIAAGVAAVVARETGNLPLALGAGVAAVLAVRSAL